MEKLKELRVYNKGDKIIAEMLLKDDTVQILSIDSMDLKEVIKVVEAFNG